MQARNAISWLHSEEQSFNTCIFVTTTLQREEIDLDHPSSSFLGTKIPFNIFPKNIELNRSRSSPVLELVSIRRSFKNSQKIKISIGSCQLVRSSRSCRELEFRKISKSRLWPFFRLIKLWQSSSWREWVKLTRKIWTKLLKLILYHKRVTKKPNDDGLMFQC